MRTPAEIIAAVRKAAEQLGVEKFDVYGTRRSSTSARVENEAPQEISVSESLVVRIRVWNDSASPGVATSSDSSDSGLTATLEEARAAAGLVVGEPVDFSPEASHPLRDSRPTVCASLPSPQQVVEALVAAERGLKSQFPCVASIPFNSGGASWAERFYASSFGATRMESFGSGWTYISGRAQQPGRKPRSGSAERTAESFEALDWDGCLREAGERLESHLGYETLTGGKPLVVFSGTAFLQLLDVFSNFVEARAVLDRQSLLSRESLGTSIAAPSLTLACHALDVRNQSRPVSFDEEGTPTRRVVLVNKGVLQTFVHSAQTAEAFAVAPTGHARCGSKIHTEVHFWVVEPSGEMVPRQVENEESVVLIQSLSSLHSGAQPRQGSFSLPFEGWMVKNGVRTSVDSGVVAGDFLSLLRSILHVGGTVDVRQGGVCPQIWVSGLTVTGA